MLSETGRYLKELFQGASSNRIAKRTGIDPSTLNKVFRGQATLSAKNIARIAEAAGCSPGRLFELSGHEQLAKLFLDAVPPSDAAFHDRLQRLLDLCLHDQVNAAFQRMEAVLAPGFQDMASRSGSRGSALIAESSHRRVAICTLNCGQAQLDEMLAGHAPEGWLSFSRATGQARLTLFLEQSTRLNEGQAQEILAVWMAGLAELLPGSSLVFG